MTASKQHTSDKHDPLLVLSRARSGTWALAGGFGPSQRFQLVGEILNPRLSKEKSFRDWVEKCTSMSDLPMAFEDYLRHLGKHVTSQQRPVLLIHYEELDVPFTIYDLVEALLKTSPNLIHLKRRNHLRQLISKKIAVETKTYRIKSEKDRRFFRIKLDTEELSEVLVEMVREEKRYDALIQMSGVPALELHYEDILSEDGNYTKQAIEKIDSFLPDLDQFRKVPWTRRQNVARLTDILENYGNVQETLVKSDMTHYLLETVHDVQQNFERSLK